MLTISDLQALSSRKAFFSPAQVSGVLGCNPYSINVQAKNDPSRLGFPVVIVGSRVRIPAVPFLRFMGVDV